jgi:hypothetical protein
VFDPKRHTALVFRQSQGGLQHLFIFARSLGFRQVLDRCVERPSRHALQRDGKPFDPAQ